jgi:cyclohexanecarboxylate-CoA ligase
MSLRPTATAPGAAHYRRAGGPWDGPPLDTALPLEGTGPDRLVDGTIRLSGSELAEQVALVAGGLRDRGVRRGDVVAWQLPNWREAVILYRASWRLGATAAPIHHGAGPVEVAALRERLIPKVWIDAASARTAGLPQGRPWRKDVALPATVAAVLFTAGSTGRPKAVLHTHRGLAYKGRLMAAVHRLTSDDAILMPAPLAHVSGLLNGVLVPHAAGMRVVLMERWNPEDALDLIERERITFMIGPPTFFVGLISAPGFSTGRVRSLRLVSSGGAGVTPAFVADATRALGCRVKRTYGSTEAPTVTTSTEDDPPDRAAETDGRAVGEVELRVSDPSSGRPLPAGKVGELWLRGPEVCAGYGDAEDTRAAFRRGWLRTGDLARVDAHGWLTIVGRIRDVIIRGGENIAAAEVEAVLEAHPHVRQAVAVGYPDDIMGERVAAFVVASEPFGLDECRSWFAERGVARFKTPERVLVVSDLPVLPAGKVDRSALRARAARD